MPTINHTNLRSTLAAALAAALRRGDRKGAEALKRQIRREDGQK